MKTIFLTLAITFNSIFSFAAEKAQTTQIVEIQVTEEGFVPNEIEVTSDTPVTLNVTRTTDNTCATEVKIKSKKIRKELPLNQKVTIDLGKLKKGNLEFACGMDMLKGAIKVK